MSNENKECSSFVLHSILTLKMTRKPASENVVCLCQMLNILENFQTDLRHTGKQSGP